MRAKKLLNNKECITEYIDSCLKSIKLNIRLAKIAKKINDDTFSFWICEAEREISKLLEFIK